MTREEQIEQVERDRRDREEAALLLLLALATRARRRVNSAIRNGSDWRLVLAAVLLGDESIDQPGGIGLLALIMADSHMAAVERTGRLVGVEVAAEETREQLVRRYEPRAREVLDRIRQSLDRNIAAALDSAVDADRISADVIAAGGAFKVTGFSPDASQGAQTEATAAVTIAYAGGMGEAYDRPEVQAVMTGLRFVNPLDDRTTGVCRSRAGVTLPLDHPWWFANWPPLHFGCRSVVLPLTGSGVKFTQTPPVLPLPEPGWGRWVGMMSAFATAP